MCGGCSDDDAGGDCDMEQYQQQAHFEAWKRNFQMKYCLLKSHVYFGINLTFCKKVPEILVVTVAVAVAVVLVQVPVPKMFALFTKSTISPEIEMQFQQTNPIWNILCWASKCAGCCYYHISQVLHR